MLTCSQYIHLSTFFTTWPPKPYGWRVGLPYTVSERELEYPEETQSSKHKAHVCLMGMLFFYSAVQMF